MFQKINIVKIFDDHNKTLRAFDTGKIRIVNLILQYGLPLIIAVIFLCFDLQINDTIATPIITALAVFCPLLLNLQMLVYGMLEKKLNNSAESGNKKHVEDLLKETYYNISFGILISILALLFFFVFFIHFSAPVNSTITTWLQSTSWAPKWLLNLFGLFRMRTILSLIGYYFLGVFVVVLLMIVKRVHVLVDNEMKK